MTCQLPGLLACVALAACSPSDEPATASVELRTRSSFVIIADGTLPAGIEGKIRRAGGVITQSLPEIGVLLVDTTQPTFAGQAKGLVGVRSLVPDLKLRLLDEDRPVEIQGVATGRFGSFTEKALPRAARKAAKKKPAPTAPAPVEISDPGYVFEWGLQAINVQAAWSRGNFGDGVRVAVLDSGLVGFHPDLQPNINFALATSFVPGESVFQEAYNPAIHYHGMHVAGTIAAAINGQFSVGVAPHAELVPIKVTDDETGSGQPGWVLAGLVYAGRIKADVANISLGGYLPLEGACDENTCMTKKEARELLVAATRAINYAHRQGVTIVAAAGNSGYDMDHTPDDIIMVPASLPHVIAVSATAPVGWAKDPTGVNLDLPASYTNYGQFVDFAAPGGDFAYRPTDELCTVSWLTQPCTQFDAVLSDYGNPAGVVWFAGTSMAVPHVAGEAALIISAHGGHMDPAQVEAALRSQATDLGKRGKDAFYGAGEIHVDKCVPATCASDGLPTCGQVFDGCGRMLDCGACPADVAITIAATPPVAATDGTTGFALAVSNAGPMTASAVQVTVTLAAGTSLVDDGGASCSASANHVICDVGALVASQIDAIHLTTTTPHRVGTIVTSARVTAEASDPDLGNNVASASTDVVKAAADVAIAITATPPAAPVDDTTGFALSLSNAGPTSATGVKVTVTLALGTTFLDGDPACTASASQVVCAVGTVAAGQTVTLGMATTTPHTPGTIMTSASVTADTPDPNLGNNVASVGTDIQPAASDLRILSFVVPPVAATDATMQVVLVMGNAGPQSATGVKMTVTLAAGTTLLDSTIPECSGSGNLVTCDLGAMGFSFTQFTFLVTTPHAVGRIVTGASVTSDMPDPDPSSNNVSAGTEIDPPSANLGLALATMPIAATDDTMGLALTINDAGPQRANGVKVTVTLAPGTTLVSSDPAVCSGSGGQVICDVGTVDASASNTVGLVTTTPHAAGMIATSAVVTADTVDPDPYNNAAIVITEIVAVADASDLSALRFDGNGQVTFPAADGGANETSFSSELWFRTLAPTGMLLEVYGVFGGADRSLYLKNGQVCFYVYTGDFSELCTSVAAGVNDGAWHHVAGTLGAGGQHLYVDGILAGASAAATSSANDSDTGLRAGFGYVGPNGAQVYFVGDLDEIRVWSVERTADEIAANRSRIINPATSGLQGYWRLDWSPLTTSAPDSTAAGNDGTLVGFPASPTSWVGPGAF